MSLQSTIALRRRNRAFRVRRRVRGSSERPRVTVHRTNMHFYAQMIDDLTGRTLCAVSSLSLDIAKGGNVAAAKKVGEVLGTRAKELGIVRACFDRGSYRYHGRVKALAEALRAAGLSL